MKSVLRPALVQSVERAFDGLHSVHSTASPGETIRSEPPRKSDGGCVGDWLQLLLPETHTHAATQVHFDKLSSRCTRGYTVSNVVCKIEIQCTRLAWCLNRSASSAVLVVPRLRPTNEASKYEIILAYFLYI